MIERDFVLKKYTEICGAIVTSSYVPETIPGIHEPESPEKSIILRHDVDRKPGRALEMTMMEHEHRIRSTYCFRTVKEVSSDRVSL